MFGHKIFTQTVNCTPSAEFSFDGNASYVNCIDRALVAASDPSKAGGSQLI